MTTTPSQWRKVLRRQIADAVAAMDDVCFSLPAGAERDDIAAQITLLENLDLKLQRRVVEIVDSDPKVQGAIAVFDRLQAEAQDRIGKYRRVVKRVERAAELSGVLAALGGLILLFA